MCNDWPHDTLVLIIISYYHNIPHDLMIFRLTKHPNSVKLVLIGGNGNNELNIMNKIIIMRLHSEFNENFHSNCILLLFKNSLSTYD